MSDIDTRPGRMNKVDALGASPVVQAPETDSLFPSLDTEHLRRLRAQLRTNIPGDATHAAAVSTLLGALVDFELATRPPVIPTREPTATVHTADPIDELDVLAK